MHVGTELGPGQDLLICTGTWHAMPSAPDHWSSHGTGPALTTGMVTERVSFVSTRRSFTVGMVTVKSVTPAGTVILPVVLL